MSKPSLKVVPPTTAQKPTYSIEQVDVLNDKFDYIKVDIDLIKGNVAFNYANGKRLYASITDRARELTRSVEQYADWDVYIDLKDPDNRNPGDRFGKLRFPAQGKSNKRSKGVVIPYTAVKLHGDISRIEVWIGSEYYEIPLKPTDPNTKHGKSFQLTGRANLYDRNIEVATAQSLQDFLDSI